MHVLLIKTSSMGDVIHALPALTDAMRAIPGIRFDWVVEEAFQEIPAWHPAVDRVIPVALRRWRKKPLKALISGEWGRFKRALRERQYDLVLDSQSLMKSAWLAQKARGPRAGFDKKSAREPLASWFYQKKWFVSPDQHAITRQRELFGAALGYPVPDSKPDSALSIKWEPDREHPYVFFLHGTSWPSKEWPEENWIELAKLANADGYQVKLTWGNEREKARAERIAAECDAIVLPRMGLGKIAQELSGASRVVGIDSGLAHIAATIGVRAITLYGATDPGKTGTQVMKQKNLVGSADCAPCLMRFCNKLDDAGQPTCWKDVGSKRVWKELGSFDNGI
jgi:heptosyltransferase-1